MVSQHEKTDPPEQLMPQKLEITERDVRQERIPGRDKEEEDSGDAKRCPRPVHGQPGKTSIGLLRAVCGQAEDVLYASPGWQDSSPGSW
jgi:hypothetical protein